MKCLTVSTGHESPQGGWAHRQRDTGRWGHPVRDDVSLPSHPAYLGYERGHGVSTHGQQLVKHTYVKLPAGLREE